MVIDIDIKIENDSGKVLHRFSKCFQDKADDFETPCKTFTLGMIFEDFLAEYLSVSGHAFRNKLIYKPNDYLEEERTDTALKETKVKGREDYGFSDHELEYKICIGNKKIYSGKIPITRLGHMDKTDQDKGSKEESTRVKFRERQRVKKDDVLYRNIFKNLKNERFQTARVMNQKLKNMLLQAIERYEVNFTHLEEAPKEESLENSFCE
jgi:hypothetical protein